MPRANRGLRLELYGPDTRFGAKKKKGFTGYCYYIVGSEGGRKIERSCATADIGVAEERLREFLDERAATQHCPPPGPLTPDRMLVSQALDLYGREHAPTVADPQRIGYAIDALLTFWANVPVSGVTGPTCRRYLAERKEDHARKAAERVAKIRARKGGAKPPRPLSNDTVRRELGVLNAALRHCVVEGHLTQAPTVWLPEKGASRDRHLSRQDIARLLRAARQSQRARMHLPLFILIAFYTGARRTAILQLQWQPNTQGGWVDLERGVIDFLGGARRTKKRRAAIPIPERLLTFLRLARRRTTKYVVEFEGKPVLNPKRSLATAGQAAGLGAVFAHLLKHSAITYLVKVGVPLWHVSEWTGTSEETIRRHYGHHAPDYLNAVRQALR